MKVITQPTVTLVSAPSFYPHPRYELPPDGAAGERLIATAGKVCYDSYGVDGNPVEKHVRSLVASGHHSVLEHVHIGVFIEGISRGCSHELVRHRMFNFSQRSTRYTAEDDAAIVLEPYYAELWGLLQDDGRRHLLRHNETLLIRQFVEEAARSLATYAEQVRLLEDLNPLQLAAGRELRKWCRGKARQNLTHALETRLVMTGNVRAWRHFLVMRTSRHAEAEMRRLAHHVYDVVALIAPIAFSDLAGELVGGFVELCEAKS